MTSPRTVRRGRTGAPASALVGLGLLLAACTAGTGDTAGSGCLIGTWELRSQEFLDQLATASEDLLRVEHEAGTYRVAFADDGTFRDLRQGWTFRGVTVDGDVITTIEADRTGPYTLGETTIELGRAEGPSSLRIQVEVGGVLTDLPAPAGGADDVSGATGTYECGGDLLTIEAGSRTSTFDRVE
jgi:hypothetical protein